MQTRRGFLTKTLGGAALLAAAGGVPLALRRTALRPGPLPALRFFTAAEYAIFAAVAERVLAAQTTPATAELAVDTARLGPALQGVLASAAAAPPVGAERPGGVDVAGRADVFFSGVDAATGREVKRLLALFDNALFSLATGGPPTPFTQLDAAGQDRQLRAWATSRLAVRRSGYQALKRLSAALYFSAPETFASVGYPGPPVELVRSVLASPAGPPQRTP